MGSCIFLLSLWWQGNFKVFKIREWDALLTDKNSKEEHGGIADALHVENRVPFLLIIDVCDARPILIQRDKSLLNSNLYIVLHLSTMFCVNVTLYSYYCHTLGCNQSASSSSYLFANTTCNSKPNIVTIEFWRVIISVRDSKVSRTTMPRTTFTRFNNSFIWT